MVRRRIAWLVALLLALPAPDARAQGSSVDLVIASTTDVHGRLRGWDYYADTAESARGLTRAATILDSVRAANPARVILVDAGDLLQGNPLTYVAARIDTLAPHAVIAAMNAMHYDAAVVGNHEFNYGLRVLYRALAQARFPFLAANATRGDGAAPWKPFVIVEREGVKVALVGVTTPGSMVWDRDHLAGHVTISDMITAARVGVRAARAAGADVVVVVAHGGLTGESTYDTVSTKLGSENPVAQMARELSGVDVIVYGHSHREVADTTINGVLLTQPRNWATSVSVAHVVVERSGTVWRVASKRASLVRNAGHAEQPELLALVAHAHEAARRYAGTVVGQTSVAWRSDSARVADLPIMDFVAEVMRRASGADLASVAAFSLDAKIPAGPVTVAELAQLYPYDNTLRALRITGRQLRAYLEQSARYFRVTGTGDAATVTPDPSIPGYNFEMVTGAEYTMDLSRPAGDRITGLAVRGKPVRDEDTFTIALSNYRAGAAGGYWMLVGAPVVHDRQLEIRQLLIDEVTRRGSLRQEDYYTRNWKVVPERLGAMAFAAMRRGGDFERVRPAPEITRGKVLSAIDVGPIVEGVSVVPALPEFLRIISTNDFHGALEARPDGTNGLRGGAAQVATSIKRAQAECAPRCATLLLDGGDEFQGTPASNLAFGTPVVQVFNALGYGAAALGNHDFDWGQDTLRARMRQARYGILSVNVRTEDGHDVGWIRADTLLERDGVKVGIIGVTTVTTKAITRAATTVGLRFDEPAPLVDAHARTLRARGAQFVVVVAHAGAFCDSAGTCRGEILNLAQQLKEPVDAIVAGHVHARVDTEVKGIPIVEAMSSGRAIAVIDLPLDRASRAVLHHEIRFVGTDSIPPDSAIASLVAAATRSVASLASRPIATATETLSRRGAQTALGNLIADAQRAAANADVAVTNNGGIRTDLRAGPVSYGSLFEVQPFGNLLVRLTLSGRTLRAYLEQLVSRAAVRAHVSGVVVRYDSTRAPMARIISAVVGGAPLDDAKTYTLAFSDFMSTGGDGLSLASDTIREETLGIVDLDALISYVRAMPGGVIKPDPAPRLVAVSP
ncbi:MAG: 5'-nucleotidase C-terminal domain-containing protein [Gemmatimonadales bacterium]